ncbi:unnamed protein product [Malus baccata var. baccata]
MLCTGRLLAVSFPVNRCSPYKLHSAGCSKFSYPRSPISTSSSRWRSLAMASEPNSSSFAPSVDSDPNPAADINPAGQVDPIVASFSGGAVGVISALMVVEINNVKQQEHKRCKYCLGTGYLACARCSSTGTLVLTEPVSTVDGGNQPVSLPKTERCSNCSGAGKVMCPTCLCTGMAMASEHDPRIDPFD